MKPTYYISKIFVRSVRNLELKVSLFAYPTKRENCYYVKLHHHHHHHHHHHVSFMDLGHLLTLSDLTYPEVSSKVYHDCFCRLGSSISLLWVIYFEAFYLHVASNFSCIPVICPKLVLFLTSLKCVHLFCNLSKCIQLLFLMYVQFEMYLFALYFAMLSVRQIIYTSWDRAMVIEKNSPV